MRIHLLRHGQTDWNESGRLQGQQDIPLNEIGQQQMERFCQQTRGPYSMIISSPLRRALQSAQICVQKLGLLIRVLPAFAERSFGRFEGMMKDDIRKQFHIDDVEELDNVHGIESIKNFRTRLEAGLQELSHTPADGPILLVTHGSVIRVATRISSLQLTVDSRTLDPLRLGRIVPNGSLVEMDLPKIYMRELPYKGGPFS